MAILGEFAGGNNTICEQAVTGMLDTLVQNSDVWMGAMVWGAGEFSRLHFRRSLGMSVDTDSRAFLGRLFLFHGTSGWHTAGCVLGNSQELRLSSW